MGWGSERKYKKPVPNPEKGLSKQMSNNNNKKVIKSSQKNSQINQVKPNQALYPTQQTVPTNSKVKKSLQMNSQSNTGTSQTLSPNLNMIVSPNGGPIFLNHFGYLIQQ